MAQIKGLTYENSTLLLAAAEELGLDPSVVTVDSANGEFVVPDEVAEKAFPKAKKAAAKKSASKE